MCLWVAAANVPDDLSTATWQWWVGFPVLVFCLTRPAWVFRARWPRNRI